MLGNKKWGGSTFYCNQRPTTNNQQQHNITRPPFPWVGKGVVNNKTSINNKIINSISNTRKHNQGSHEVCLCESGAGSLSQQQLQDYSGHVGLLVRVMLDCSFGSCWTVRSGHVGLFVRVMLDCSFGSCWTVRSGHVGQKNAVFYYIFEQSCIFVRVKLD